MKRVGAAAAALAMFGILSVAIPPAVAAPAVPVPVDPGGADLVSVSLDDSGRLSMGLRTATGQLHDPAAVVLPETGGVTGAVPDQPAYGFLGGAGRPVWAIAPSGTDFPAWDATGVPADLLAGDTVTLELVDVDGPGGFHAYTISPVGEPQLMLGTSGGAPQRAALPAGVRRGGAIWVFDAPGMHRVTLAAEAMLTSGATSIDQAVYQVEVPALPAEAPPLSFSRTAGPPAAAAPAPLAQQPAAPSDAETGEGQVVIGDGHVDIGPRFVDGAWTIQVKDDTVSPVVWRNFHDVVLQANDNALMEVPDSADFSFLGQPGDEVWLLPQAQQAGILWPGWNTEHASVVEGISGSTTWTLREVTGPGEFVLFLTGSFGASDILFTTRESLPQQMSVPLRTHAHGNWAFTEPGVYHLSLQVSGTTTGGEQVSDARVLAFAVGDQTDPDTAFPPAGGGSGTGDGGGPGDGGGALGKTGLNLVALIGAGAMLLAIGVALVLVTIRRVDGRPVARWRTRSGLADPRPWSGGAVHSETQAR